MVDIRFPKSTFNTLLLTCRWNYGFYAKPFVPIATLATANRDFAAQDLTDFGQTGGNNAPSGIIFTIG